MSRVGAVVNDLTSLLSPVIPELKPIGMAAIAIGDTAGALSQGLSTGNMGEAIKTGLANLARDEFASLNPVTSAASAIADLSKRASSALSGIPTAQANALKRNKLTSFEIS